jgi:hypothetical protein
VWLPYDTPMAGPSKGGRGSMAGVSRKLYESTNSDEDWPEEIVDGIYFDSVITKTCSCLKLTFMLYDCS